MALATLVHVLALSPQVHHLRRPSPPRASSPSALLPKAIIPFFFIPTYVQIGYAVEATYFDGKGPFTRLIKSDFVQKSGARMKRIKNEPPKCRAARLPAEAKEITASFKKDYARKDLEYLWGALLKVYGNKDRALRAAQSNPQMLNPAYSFPNTMLESKRVLRDVMSESEALEIMQLNPAVLQCGPSLDLFGTDEIRMIAQMRSMGNELVPAPARSALVGLLVGGVAITIAAQQDGASDNATLQAVVDALRPLLGLALGSTFAVAVYGAAQIGKKPPAKA